MQTYVCVCVQLFFVVLLLYIYQSSSIGAKDSGSMDAEQYNQYYAEDSVHSTQTM